MEAADLAGFSELLDNAVGACGLFVMEPVFGEHLVVVLGPEREASLDVGLVNEVAVTRAVCRHVGLAERLNGP